MSKQKGFSLIELLVVISIISVLTTVGIISFTGAQRSARDVQRKNDLRVVQYALAEYYQDNRSSYPNSANFAALVSLLKSGTKPYLDTTPSDPKFTTPGYQYESIGNGTGYTLKACLEVETDPAGTPISGPFNQQNCPSKKMYVVTNP